MMNIIASIEWSEIFNAANMAVFLRIVMLAGIGFPLLFIIAAYVGKVTGKKLNPQAMGPQMDLFISTGLLAIWNL